MTGLQISIIGALRVNLTSVDPYPSLTMPAKQLIMNFLTALAVGAPPVVIRCSLPPSLDLNLCITSLLNSLGTFFMSKCSRDGETAVASTALSSGLVHSVCFSGFADSSV